MEFAPYDLISDGIASARLPLCPCVPLCFYGVGHTTGNHGRALSAYIGEVEVPMVSIVGQALPVAGMAVVSIGIEGIVSASSNTFKTVDACLVEAEFFFGHRRWLQSQIRHEASEATGTALFGDDQIVHTETSDPGRVCHVSVRPVAHQALLIKVVGGRDQGHPVAV